MFTAFTQHTKNSQVFSGFCVLVIPQQSQCYQTSYHHPLRAARLVHTIPNQWACLLGQREAPDCKSALFPSSTPILFWVWGRAAWLTSSLGQQSLPHILRKQRRKTMSRVSTGGSWGAFSLLSCCSNSLSTIKCCCTILFFPLTAAFSPFLFPPCHTVSMPSLFPTLVTSLGE